MTKKEIAKVYLDFLSEGETHKIISLFSSEGKVDSPLFGIMNVHDFYSKLESISKQSIIQLKQIYYTEGSSDMAIYFNYQWELENGTSANFDVVDLLQFDEFNKIINLKIIYDTQATRSLI